MNRVFRALRKALAAVTVATLCGMLLPAAVAPASARDSPPAEREVAVATLPREARDVLERIRAGGPFQYERDGVVFGNREHSLPPRKHGFYHEYTVVTPGARNRGARRIVCGGPRVHPQMCYYTDDHYASFRRIRE